jgi:NmrA-like family
MDQRILVTGATGETGRYTTELLIKQGFSVRALAHKKDERSEKLRATGAEVGGGDLRDFDAVRQALKGVGRTYFVYPIRPGSSTRPHISPRHPGKPGSMASSTCRRFRRAKTPRAMLRATTDCGARVRLVRRPGEPYPADLLRPVADLSP